MASKFTRKERYGSIFFRVTGLIRSGQLKWDDRPLWYDVYAAHPPHYEPKWDARKPNHDKPVTPIFYREDVDRARFYKDFGSAGVISLTNNENQSLGQKFRKKLEEARQSKPELNQDELFAVTMKMMERDGVYLSAPIKDSTTTTSARHRSRPLKK